MSDLPSRTLFVFIFINLSVISSFSSKANHTFLDSNLSKLKKYSRSKFVLFEDLLDDLSKGSPLFKYEVPKYPPYPYYDAPRNLFFNVSKLNNKKDDKSNSEEYKESEVQEEFMRNAKLRRKGRRVPAPDTSPLAELKKAIGSDFRDYVYSENKTYREDIRTDLSAYDEIHKGFGPWPSYQELKEKGLDVNTSMMFEIDTEDYMEKHLQTKPMRRKEVKTIAEAREEQLRWLERSRNDEWPLTYKEFAELPLEMREEYYKNRFPACDMDEQFLMVLNYRKALEKKQVQTRFASFQYDKNPMEFDLMESDYTYTPKQSPVLGDLKNWDDPLECAWRLRANEAISDCVSYGWPRQEVRFHTGMDVYDITWLPAVVKVVVERTRNECGNINKKELQLMLLKLKKRLEQLDTEENTRVLKNHVIVLCTHQPGSKVLHSRREWNHNSGREATITMNDEERTKFEGELLGSDSTFGIKIKVGGEKLTLPLPFVYEVEYLTLFQYFQVKLM